MVQHKLVSPHLLVLDSIKYTAPKRRQLDVYLQHKVEHEWLEYFEFGEPIASIEVDVGP